MKSLMQYIFAQVVAGAIVFISIVVVAFALTGQWPPEAVLVGASLGGAMSPLFWRWVRHFRDRRDSATDEGAMEVTEQGR